MHQLILTLLGTRYFNMIRFLKSINLVTMNTEKRMMEEG